MRQSQVVVLVAVGLLGVTIGCTTDGQSSGDPEESADESTSVPQVGPTRGMAKDAGALRVDAGSVQADDGGGSIGSFVCTDPQEILWGCSSLAELEAAAASLCDHGLLQLKYDRDPACGGGPIAAWASCCTELGGSSYDAGVVQVRDAGTTPQGTDDAGDITPPGIKDAGGITSPGTEDGGSSASPRACSSYLLGDGTCAALDDLQQRAIEACSAENAMLTRFEIDDAVCAGGATEVQFECCALARQAPAQP